MIDMINELHQYVQKGSEQESLNETFLRLSVYTVKHFIYEETLFKKHGYQNQQEHKKEHDDLAERLTEFHKKYSVQREDITEELLKFFEVTMFNHIAVYDHQYIEFMTDNGIQ